MTSGRGVADLKVARPEGDQKETRFFDVRYYGRHAQNASRFNEEAEKLRVFTCFPEIEIDFQTRIAARA